MFVIYSWSSHTICTDKNQHKTGGELCLLAFGPMLIFFQIGFQTSHKFHDAGDPAGHAVVGQRVASMSLPVSVLRSPHLTQPAMMAQCVFFFFTFSHLLEQMYCNCGLHLLKKICIYFHVASVQMDTSPVDFHIWFMATWRIQASRSSIVVFLWVLIFYTQPFNCFVHPAFYTDIQWKSECLYFEWILCII